METYFEKLQQAEQAAEATRNEYAAKAQQVTEQYSADLISLLGVDLYNQVWRLELDRTSALAEIDAAAKAEQEKCAAAIVEAENQIRAAILECGKSVKHGAYHAVYVKGRVKWDNDKLEGMLALIPQIETARTIGEPTVQIRRTK